MSKPQRQKITLPTYAIGRAEEEEAGQNGDRMRESCPQSTDR